MFKDPIHMSRCSKPYDINNEFIIVRYQQGVKLCKPSLANEVGQNTLSNLFHMPIAAIFMDPDSRIIEANDGLADALGAVSLHDIKNKTAKDFFKKQTAEIILAHDQEVLRNRAMKIAEEPGNRLDDYCFEALAFKFPWYYEKNVIGTFVCSIVISHTNCSSLAVIFSQLIAMGLLDSTHRGSERFPQFQQNNDSTLSQREKAVISYLTRGMTAKKIAYQLGISNRTVEHHIARIKSKTLCSTKSDLIDKFTTEL
jgi:DNA-binding CsgD family transcriptional regulator